MKRKNYGQVLKCAKAIEVLNKAHDKATAGELLKAGDPDPIREMALAAELHKEYTDGDLDSRITRAATWVKSQMAAFCEPSRKYFGDYSVTNRTFGQCVQKTSEKSGKVKIVAIYRDGHTIADVSTDDKPDDADPTILYITHDDMESLLLRNVSFKLNDKITFDVRADEIEGNPSEHVLSTDGERLYPVVDVAPKSDESRMEDGTEITLQNDNGDKKVLSAAEVNEKIDLMVAKHRDVLAWVAEKSSRREKNPADFRDAAIAAFINF